MEYWDIYDAEKQPTGRKMKRNDWCLKDGEYHLTVLGVVARPDGTYLITKRVMTKAWAPGWWEVSGGAAQAGESSEEAVCREVREETGLSLTSYRFCGLVTFLNSKCDPELMCVFTADDFTGELTECREGDLCWVDKKQVLSLPTWEGDRGFLELLLSGEKRFFSIRLLYEGDRLVDQTVHLY